MFTCTYTSLTMWKIALWTGFLTPIHLSWNIATAGSKFVIWLFFIVAMFFPDGHGFDCFPMFSISSAQRFPVRSAQQSVCGSPCVPVPPCHAMSCPLFPQNGDSEKHLSLPASRWGLGQSQRLMVFRKLRPNFGPRDEFYCEADSIWDNRIYIIT